MLIKAKNKDGHRISTLPSAIVRFTNRDIRNRIYANRKPTRLLNLKSFLFQTPSYFHQQKLDPNPKTTLLKSKTTSKKYKMEVLLNQKRLYISKKNDETEVFSSKIS